jgi:hypothetical protein
MPARTRREKAFVRKLLLALPLLGLLGGCAGYAADYMKSKPSLIGPQLTRFGLSGAQSDCVAKSLGKSLSVWQVRQLADTAERARGGDNGRLTVRELLYVSRLVPDPEVPAGLAKAVESCGVVATAAASAPPATATGPAPVLTTPPATSTPPVSGATPAQPVAPAKGSVWVNLGTAASGQSISIDASSVQEEPPYRKAWFRLSNPGETGPGNIAYLLRVDCPARTITPLGGRKHDASGAITEQKDYGAEWEGALPVEAGTVMEIAFRSLCG